jgi:hypothetical protein
MYRSNHPSRSRFVIAGCLALPASFGFADAPDRAVLGPVRSPDGSFIAVVRWPVPTGVPEVAAWIDSTGGRLASLADGPANGVLRCLRSEPWLALDPCDGPWLGLERPAAAPPASEPWRWADGTPVTFLAWAEGRPAGSPRLPAHAALDDEGRWLDLLGGPEAGAAVRSAAVHWPAGSDGDGNGVPDPLERDGIEWIPGDPTCVRNPADLDGNGRVDASDLAIVLANWGGRGSGDVDDNGVVDANDLGEVLGRWS